MSGRALWPLLLLAACLTGCASFGVPATARLAGLAPMQQPVEIEAAKLIIAARGLMAVHEWATAKEKLAEAERLRRTLFREPSLALDEIELLLGTLYLESGQPSRSIALLHKIGRNLLNQNYSDSMLRADLSMELAERFSHLGFAQYSEELFGLIVRLRTSAFGADHILTKIAGFWKLKHCNELHLLSDKYLEQFISLIEEISEEDVDKYSSKGLIHNSEYFLTSTDLYARQSLASRWIQKGELGRLRSMLRSLEFQTFEMKNGNIASLKSARLNALIGDIYLDLGDTTRAGRGYAEAYESINRLERAMLSVNDRFFDHSVISRIDIQLRCVYHWRSAILERLAIWAHRIGYYSKSERYLRWAVTERLSIKKSKETSNGDLYEIFHLLGDLGEMYWRQGKEKIAATAWYDAMDIFEERFRQLSSDQGESLLLGQIGSARSLSEAILDLLAQAQQPSPSILSDVAMASVLLTQGRVADEVATQNTFTGTQQEAAAVALHKQFGDLRLRLSALEWSGLRHQNSSEYESTRRQLEGDMLHIEQQLREVSTGPVQRDLPWSHDIVRKVSAQVPADSILVHYTKYTHSHLVTNNSVNKSSYLALLMTKDSGVTVVRLGDAREIDQIVHRLRQSIINKSEDYQTYAQGLYRKIVQPLRPWVQASPRLMIVPDGSLHMIPFEVLSDGAHLLGDTKDIVYLSSGRDLLSNPRENPNTDIVVFANPDLNAIPGERGQQLPPAPIDSAQHLRTLERRRTPRGIAFSSLGSLRGAEDEAKDIAKLYPGTLLNLSVDASEQKLFQLRAPPGILHISAHGLFLQTETLGLGDQIRGPLAVEREGPPLNPLLRSMILLAGAARGRQQQESEYDGLATALEISTLSLSGTQMVVLSSCESGLGVVSPGEGVAGLRRAFFVAGAETVVASLWSVDDAVTRELMGDFYRHLRAGEGRARALHQAAATIRNQHPHPFYWASFVVIGQGGPLRGMNRSAGEAETTAHRPRRF